MGKEAVKGALKNMRIAADILEAENRKLSQRSRELSTALTELHTSIMWLKEDSRKKSQKTRGT